MGAARAHEDSPVPGLGRVWCSPRMRPVVMSLGAITTVVLAVTLVPDPAAMAREVEPVAGPSPLEAFQVGPDAATGGELVADDEIGAVVQSRATGRRVEVLSLRSMTSRTWVNPEGTWTTEEAAGPVRFVDEAGVWQDIDLDLEVGADGAVVPGAHPLGLVLPGGDAAEAPAPGEVGVEVGGAAPKDTVPAQALSPVTEASGEQVGLGWPGALPEPELAGPLATYRDVTPGVDLQVLATSVGYETFMIIDERPAADAVVSWTLPVTATGVEPVAREDGSIEFVSTGEVDGGTPAGEVVSVLPSAHAWDAQVDQAADIPTNVADVAMTVTTSADGTPAVTVTPDAAWLQDPGTVFPVTVDPTYASATVSTTADTYVQSDTGTAVHGGKTELRVGTYNGGTAKARSFLSFDSAAMAGKNVQDARLSLYATHSYSCSARNWEAWSAGGFSEASTVWSNQPAMGTKYGTSAETKGYGSGCAAGYVGITITSLVKAWAGQAVGTKVMGLKAENESDTYGWKKFASRESGGTAPKIVFTYNRPAAVPAAPSVVNIVKYTPPGSTTAGNYSASRTPTLATSGTDPDGNTVKYEIQLHSSTAGTAESLKATCTTALVASGSTGSCVMPILADNAVYYARAKGIDQLGASTGWSGYWGFTVASTAPPAPTVTCPGYANGSWTTSVPTADVTCTITAVNSGATTAGYIHHRIDESATSTRQLITPPPAGSTSSVQVKLSKAEGRHVIRARTESRAGIQSAAVDFTVGWGSTVTMNSPKPASAATTASDGIVVTNDVLALSASGPSGGTAGGGTPTAKVQWRTAGGVSSAPWNDATGATVTVTSANGGYTAAGKVSTQAMTIDNGTTLNERVPVRLDVRLCFVYSASTTNCATSPGVVQRVPHAFGSGYPVAEAGPGQVALWTGEWTTSSTDVSVPGYTGDLSISRTHASYSNGGSTADPVTGVFGPGWTANFDGADAGVAGDDLEDNTTADGTLVLFDEADSPLVWAPPGTTGTTVIRRTGTALTTGTWVPADEDTRAFGAVLKVTTAGSTTTKAVVTVTLEDGTITTFETTGNLTTGTAQFSPHSVQEPGVSGATSYVRDSAGRITAILAPAAPGVTCGTSWATTRGCRGLTVTYATATTASATATGDIAGQVKEVAAVLWDPAKSGGAGMRSIPVAQYAYGASKRLSSVTDPRTGLATAYSYDGSSPRISRITPPGLTGIDITYVASLESGTGGAEVRFARATRPRPAGDPAGGTAVLAAAVYAIPTSGTAATGLGLPDMTTRSQAWDQAKTPTYGAAVLGPNAPGSFTTSPVSLSAEQWTHADLQYTDAEGYTINTADYGAGDWQLTATDYDDKGNVVRSLDQRATAVVARQVSADEVTSNRALADQLATLTFYDAEGILVTDTLAPARDAVLQDGTTAFTREWTHTDYDDGATGISDITDVTTTPVNEKTLNPVTGNPWRLPTRVTSLTVPGETTGRDTNGAFDGITNPGTLTGNRVLSRSITSYGTTKASWTLGLPVSSTTDIDASGTSNAGDITTQTTYDAEGKTTSTTQPGATAGETSTDAGTNLSRYYTAGTHPLDAACGNRPEWAGLACTNGPGSSSPLPGSRTTLYNVWLQPITVEEHTPATGAKLRTSVTRYDAAGRTTGTFSFTSTGVAGNVATTGSTTTYSPNTGLVTATTETTAPASSVTPPTANQTPPAVPVYADTNYPWTSTGRGTSTSYDGWGRVTSVTGDDGLTTTTTYDAAGRVRAVTIPVGGGTGPDGTTAGAASSGVTTNHTTTYTYDGTDSLNRQERRGLTTSVEVTGLAAQTGAYDEAGTLVHEQLPGRITRTRVYDTAGEPTEVTYTGPTKTRDASGAIVDGDPAPWFAWAQANDVEGRVRAEWTPDAIGYNAPMGDGTDLPVAGQAAGYSRVFTYDRAERLTRVLDYTRPAPGTGSTDTPTGSGTDVNGLVCVARAYTFDTRGRRTQLTSTNGLTDGAGACPAAEAPATTTRTATYDTADRPLTGTTNLTGTSATGNYVYDTLGRQTAIPAVDSPAYTAGDNAAGPIQVTYDTTDTARSLSQAVTVRIGTSDAGEAVNARVLETTQLALDSSGQRQMETVTSTPLDASGAPSATATVVSTLTRHYSDSSDNPSWTFTNTPARHDAPAKQERGFSAEGLGGYTATVTSDLTGALTGAHLNISNLHGDITTTIPLTPAISTTPAGQGSSASEISAWQHSDEYGNPVTAPGSNGVHIPKKVGASPGSATTTGPNYGWLGTHERAITAAGLTLMGARLYNPSVGAFTTTDPVPGGNTTAYVYPQDPINQTDIDGKAKKKKKGWWGRNWKYVAAVGIVLGVAAVCIFATAACGAAVSVGVRAGSAVMRAGKAYRATRHAHRAVMSSSRFMNKMYHSRHFGAKSKLFGDKYSGAKAGLLNRDKGKWAVGWSGARVAKVNGKNRARTVFRVHSPRGKHWDIGYGPWR